MNGEVWNELKEDPVRLEQYAMALLDSIEWQCSAWRRAIAAGSVEVTRNMLDAFDGVEDDLNQDFEDIDLWWSRK